MFINLIGHGVDNDVRAVRIEFERGGSFDTCVTSGSDNSHL